MIKEVLETKIEKDFDVCVCGGGFAGVSAALAAARLGKKTILIEKQFMLGGLGTAGLVTIYLPLCDGFGRQISFGIAEELFRLSIKYGAEGKYPENWLEGKGTRTENDKRFEVQYNPQLCAILLEQLLIKEGVTILYGTSVTSVHKENDKIDLIITENKTGRRAYKVKSVVDATGDADICVFAEAPTDTFKQGNILASWYYFVDKDGYHLNKLGYADIPDEEKTKDNPGTPRLIDRRFTGLTGEEISEMAILSHASLLNDFIEKRKKDESTWPVTMATTPQVRMTRKIVGDYVLLDTEAHKEFSDSVGMIANWRRRGPVYEVPFKSLYSSKVKNLITAGRCTSVNETMWNLMRVIPCCAVTGQAAGTAAALTDDFTTLDIKKLQKVLKENGVVLHEKDL